MRFERQWIGVVAIAAVTLSSGCAVAVGNRSGAKTPSESATEGAGASQGDSPLAASPQSSGQSSEKGPKTISDTVAGLDRSEGFFDFYWDEKEGKLWLEIDRFDQELLYVKSLSAGVGSNDIGLDRGQLGGTHVVEFRRLGPKVLLIEKNYRFRAVSDNPAEARAVEEAFARSVHWGFEVAAEEGGRVLVDATPFLLRDAHDVVGRLRAADQGTYRLDESRSAVNLERTRNFPQNTELDAFITYVGEPRGFWIRSVTPDASAVTVQLHHSFIELPELAPGGDGYHPRRFDVRSGYGATRYFDYATPISEPLEKRYINRHRLEKRDPTASVSEPVEPIVYYLDSGAPEPIRSALLDGARWWNQAFEAAGFRDGFRVEVLPEDADPLDIRYNVIQWVHRSTRGWSYGSSVSDPRTGEILKGHVTLGSLRVRQDFLIAEALLAPYENGDTVPPEMVEMALARLRQLSAHEVGHTLGIMHNYASSMNDRASVMDYPHPRVTLAADGSIDLDDAYDTGIGEWDKRAILYGYAQFPPGVDEDLELDQILLETDRMGLHFITDQDARPPGSAHPLAHLWDNGTDAAAALDNALDVRAAALARFGERNVRNGTPLWQLQDVLVPLYLLHRYQIEAAAKVLGGQDYTYAVRGDERFATRPVPPEDQLAALEALLRSIDPEVLTLPESVIELLPPPAAGYRRGRESLPTRTGVTFDPVATAGVAAEMTLGFVLHSERATRLVNQHARQSTQPSLASVLDSVLDSTWRADTPAGLAGEVKREVDDVALRHLMALAMSKAASSQARALALQALRELHDDLEGAANRSGVEEAAHLRAGAWMVERFLDDPEEIELPRPLQAPDGSPIGSDEQWLLDPLACTSAMAASWGDASQPSLQPLPLPE